MKQRSSNFPNYLTICKWSFVKIDTVIFSERNNCPPIGILLSSDLSSSNSDSGTSIWVATRIVSRWTRNCSATIVTLCYALRHFSITSSSSASSSSPQFNKTRQKMETFRATLAPARQSCAIIRKIKFVRFFCRARKMILQLYCSVCQKYSRIHSLRHSDMVKTNENEWSAGCQFGGVSIDKVVANGIFIATYCI